MTPYAKMRLRWIELYQSTNGAGPACRRCCLSRPTSRRWLRRYERDGMAGLESCSSRPKTSPTKKVLESSEGVKGTV